MLFSNYELIASLIILVLGKTCFCFFIFESYKELGLFNFYEDKVCVAEINKDPKHLQLWNIYRRF